MLDTLELTLDRRSTTDDPHRHLLREVSRALVRADELQTFASLVAQRAHLAAAIRHMDAIRRDVGEVIGHHATVDLRVSLAPWMTVLDVQEDHLRQVSALADDTAEEEPSAAWVSLMRSLLRLWMHHVDTIAALIEAGA